VIGAPLDRVDGPRKVSGSATYAYEEASLGQPLYGFILGATIARGTITMLETARAEVAPGVRRVLTHRDVAWQRPAKERVGYSHAYPVMASPDIASYGDPVALVIAETLEQARAAASLIDVGYERAEGRFELAAHESFVPNAVNAGLPVETHTGSFEQAFAAAPVQLDQLYTTPYEHSMPMEPHCCLAAWTGDKVTVHVSTQVVASAQQRVAATLGLEPSQVTIICRFVGGGFGSKLGLHAEAILAVIGAREVRQPVKIALTRQQMFDLVGHRPASRQRIRLAAERDGRLIAFGHDVVNQASTRDDYIEQVAATGRPLYAAPHRRTTHRAVTLDLMAGEDVRAPGDAPGMLAIETAMDELAHQLQIDPIELRIKNEPAMHPEDGVPFADRRLVECLREGARRFGWHRRKAVPASVRDGRWLVGYGMAAAIRGHFQAETTVRVILEPAGTATVQSDMTDLGTGTYTILTQVAAETLGLAVDHVEVKLGHSDFPASAGSGGSWGATNSCAATYRACRAAREQLLAAITADERSPLFGAGDRATFAGGRIVDGSAREALTDVLARHFPDGLEVTGTCNGADDPLYEAYSLSTYGAHFAEVRVDADTGEIRLARMLGVFACGRVFNAKTARSQLIGGMIWGVGAALHEDGVVDPRYGEVITRDLAQYLVPVHADIPAIDAILLDDYDDKANELGAKGLGELAICGSGAAIGNAIFNATGVRVRDFPITLEKLLPALP
jgi:xanthine dehydrogenase YagR molybdenum-binding subunit